MARAERLIALTQALRRRRRPVTANQLADELRVSDRTIYRDIVTLQGSGVPIRGEAGVGYILDAGFDLPPLMFTVEECEALMLGARFVRERADPQLVRAVEDAIAKIEAVLPAALRPHLAEAPLYAPIFGEPALDVVDVAVLRGAMREGRKIRLAYRDVAGSETIRILWPVLIAYYEQKCGLVAWCELRADFRFFRTDRMLALDVLSERIPRRRAVLVREWERSRHCAESRLHVEGTQRATSAA